ncbi:hypothetical protein CEE69_15190 [Rhodopirellula bahusiensis]|uniref:Uncharacterized protein n=1 Tax=Rhodopirellula bahusiensis TaxID=2014065 RepID=A0A2G1W6A6_9BACT|nr:hypothetical protein CEE69_15190 [Rhodopirellula bahusiensis]
MDRGHQSDAYKASTSNQVGTFASWPYHWVRKSQYSLGLSESCFSNDLLFRGFPQFQTIWLETISRWLLGLVEHSF